MFRVCDAHPTLYLPLHWSDMFQTSCDSTVPLFIVCFGSVKVILHHTGKTLISIIKSTKNVDGWNRNQHCERPWTDEYS